MRRLAVGLAMLIAALAPCWAQADDRQIAQQIVQKLNQEKEAGTLQRFTIDLEVEDGTVWLKGQVASAAQQRRALDVARNIPGVKQVVNDLAVRREPSEPSASPAATAPATAPAITPAREPAAGSRPRGLLANFRSLGEALPFGAAATPSDQQIAQSLERQLQEEQRKGTLAQFAIELNVNEGVVVMGGEVADAEQLRRALELARRTAGVERVVNRMSIRGAQPQGLPQPLAVARPVESRLPAPALAARPVAASQPGPSLDDDRIADAIFDELEQQQSAGRLRGFGIEVEVIDGQVWLKGHVANYDQQRLVIETARRVPGVAHVVNELAVHEPVKPVQLERPSADEPAPSVLTPATHQHSLPTLESFQPESAPVAPQPVVVPQPVAPQPAALQPAAPQPVPQPAAAQQTSATKQADERIAQDILRTIESEMESGRLGSFHIDLRVAHGDVWVEGIVSSVEHQQRALDIARRTAGVRQVVNALEVQPLGDDAVMLQIQHDPAGAVRQAARQTAEPAQLELHGGQSSPASLAKDVALGAAGIVAAPVAMAAGYGPMAAMPAAGGPAVQYDHPAMPAYAWPSYAAHPNYGALSYPRQYSPTAWPYIGPFYPYPQVPLGWRKVTLQWDDGWWWLDFKSR